jgi:DNA-binding transcriptional MerR regulator
MEQQERLLIGELARLAGVTPRTIRYYTSEGLLPPPSTRGKYATYSSEHLRLLRLIARLKEDYLPLSAISERLATMSAAERERLLGEGGQGLQEGPDAQGRAEAQGGREPRRWPQSGAAHGPSQGAAGMLGERPASYELPGAQEPGAPSQGELLATGLADPFRLAPAQLPLGRVEFFPAAPGAAGSEADAGEELQQGAAGSEELWRHFPLAPGIELRVREPLPPRRRHQIAALLAALRDKLQGEEE